MLTSQDIRYRKYDLVLELDGRIYHETPQAADDSFRDLAEKANGNVDTLRLTYGLVFHDPCRTARLLATVLQDRGWKGASRLCPRCRNRRFD